MKTLVQLHVVGFFAICLNGAAMAQDNDALIERLRNLDGTLLTEFTLRLQGEDPPLMSATDLGPRNVTTTVIKSDGRLAIARDFHAIPIVKYASSPEGINIKYDPAKNRIATIRTREIYLYDNDISAVILKSTPIRISPSGENTVLPENTLTEVYPSRSKDLAWQPTKSLWMIGRGYGDFLDEVTAYREESGEKVSVVARGRDIAGTTGSWVLQIDKAALYMVRRAEFTSDMSREPSIRVSTEGTVWHGAMCVPETSFWRDGIVFTRADAPPSRVVEFSREPDVDLVRQLFEIFTSPQISGTRIDNRSSPRLVEHFKTNANQLRTALSEGVEGIEKIAPLPDEAPGALAHLSPSPIRGPEMLRSDIAERDWITYALGGCGTLLAVAAIIVLLAKRRGAATGDSK